MQCAAALISRRPGCEKYLFVDVWLEGGKYLDSGDSEIWRWRQLGISTSVIVVAIFNGVGRGIEVTTLISFSLDLLMRLEGVVTKGKVVGQVSLR